LAVAAVSLWRENNELTSRPPRLPAEIPQFDAAVIPLVTGEEAVEEQFLRAGCPVCHTIPGIAAASGLVGPPLVLGTTASARLADPRYNGRAKTVREYIIESILTPQEYVVPGYPEKTMPSWYGSKLSASALDQMVSYLEQITEDRATRP
jgi:hypothetical protein